MIKEKRRKKRRLKKILIGLLIFLLLAVVTAFVVIKVFVVKNVKVEGNKLYDEQLIKTTVLNDEYSWNSLYVLLKYKFIETDAVPFIDTMEIKMNNPQSLTITVYEKGMLGRLDIGVDDKNAYFDKDGFVVEISNRIIENVPIIHGTGCEDVVLYQKLPMESQQLRELLTLTQALKREGLVPDSIHYGVENEPELYYGSVTVQMGTMEHLTQKVDRLKEILPQLDGLTGVLHMETWTEETTNIIFEKVEPVEDTGGEDASDDEDNSGEGSEGENSPEGEDSSEDEDTSGDDDIESEPEDDESGDTPSQPEDGDDVSN